MLQDGADFNERWGHLSRAGVNDKSQLQVRCRHPPPPMPEQSNVVPRRPPHPQTHTQNTLSLLRCLCLQRQIEKYADIYTSRVSNFERWVAGRLVGLRALLALCAHPLCSPPPPPTHTPTPQLHALPVLSLAAAGAVPRPPGV